MSQTKSALIPEQFPLVNESDYVQLSRLVLEHAWRADNGRADTIHELYVDYGVLDLPPARQCRRPSHLPSAKITTSSCALKRDGASSRAAGSNSLREAMP